MVDLNQRFQFAYADFAEQPIFRYEALAPHGITPDIYTNVRRGYATLMAGVSAGEWYRTGCMPLLFLITIIGIPIFVFLQYHEGITWRRVRNAAIFALRAAAEGDADYMRFLAPERLSSISTVHQPSVF
jgi:hypothetical protein